MKIAFAHWDNRIAPVFDTARQLCVIDVDAGQIVGEREEPLPEDLMVQKTLRLVELGISTLVCGAISRPVHGQISAYGIQVIPFVAGDLRAVIRACLQGSLMQGAFAMPGCRGRERQGFRGMHASVKEVDTMERQGRGKGGGGGKGQGRQGQRPGRLGGGAAQAAGFCVCPQCGHQEPHERGVPCMGRSCPQCGKAMVRQ